MPLSKININYQFEIIVKLSGSDTSSVVFIVLFIYFLPVEYLNLSLGAQKFPEVEKE